jgi:hypothetical protein
MNRTTLFWPGTLVILANLLTISLAAQQPAGIATPVSGFDASISVDSNHGGNGTWHQLTPGIGYTFNPRWSVTAAVPLYVVSAGATDEGTAGLRGIGDVYGSLSLDLSSDAVTFYTTVTASAPTGSVDKNLGAGQTSWDWTGHLASEFGRLVPYVTGGVGNNTKAANESLGLGAGIARPGTDITIGSLAHAETGVEISIWKSMTLTASGYGVFALKGPAALDEVSDHGVGLVLWDQVTPSLDLSLWLSHSLAYLDYTTLSVSATYSWKHAGRRRQSRADGP